MSERRNEAPRRVTTITTGAQRKAETLFGSALQQMPDEFLECRDIRHLWEVTRNYHVVDAVEDAGIQPRMGHNTFVERKLRCTRCGMVRSDAYVIAKRARWQGLERLSSTYTMPEGYGVQGVGHMQGAGDMIRYEAYQRVLKEM
jgi:hypothetical protein